MMEQLHQRATQPSNPIKWDCLLMQEFHTLNYYQHFPFFNKLNHLYFIQKTVGGSQSLQVCVLFSGNPKWILGKTKISLCLDWWVSSHATFEYCSHSEGISRMETRLQENTNMPRFFSIGYTENIWWSQEKFPKVWQKVCRVSVRCWSVQWKHTFQLTHIPRQDTQGTHSNCTTGF